MVEKWLLQVEDVMISSLRKVVIDSKNVYPTTPRNNWVLQWPGQVVLCVSSMFWTTEVVEAMEKEGGNGLAVSN
jgi:dynein heavy chain